MDRRYSGNQQNLQQPEIQNLLPTSELNEANQNLSLFIQDVLKPIPFDISGSGKNYEQMRNIIEDSFEINFRPQDDQIDFIKKRLKSRLYKNSGKVLDKIKMSKSIVSLLIDPQQAKIGSLDSGKMLQTSMNLMRAKEVQLKMTQMMNLMIPISKIWSNRIASMKKKKISLMDLVIQI